MKFEVGDYLRFRFYNSKEIYKIHSYNILDHRYNLIIIKSPTLNLIHLALYHYSEEDLSRNYIKLNKKIAKLLYE